MFWTPIQLNQPEPGAPDENSSREIPATLPIEAMSMARPRLIEMMDSPGLVCSQPKWTKHQFWQMTAPGSVSTVHSRKVLSPGSQNGSRIASALFWGMRWEIAIKHALGREHMPISGSQAISYFAAAGYEMIPVTHLHAAAAEDLADHHRDPFDRILLAQAISEPLHLLTHDSMLKAYGDLVVSV